MNEQREIPVRRWIPAMSMNGAKALGAAAILAGALLLAVCDTTGPEVPVPAAVQAEEGANETVQVATEVTLAAKVTDRGGAAVSDVTVEWAIVSGGGSLTAASSTTNDAGMAQVVWTVGTTAGLGEARASVEGVPSPAGFPVTLTPGPAAVVTLSADTARFTALDDTATYSASAEDAFGNTAVDTVTWAVADEGVATVSDGGLVTAVSPGETFVTATSDAAVDTLTVLVSQEPMEVDLSPIADTIASGGTTTLEAEAMDANHHPIDNAVFEWASSDTTVAAVDDHGMVEGRAAGRALITAGYGGVVGTAMVRVRAGAVASVSVDPASVDFSALADTMRLAAEARDAHDNPVAGTNVAWGSTDTTVATVDGSGLVTAAGNGHASVVAYVGGVQDSVAVTVQQAAVEITAEPDTIVFTALNDTVRLSTAALDANAFGVPGGVVWTSTDASVASVSDGLVLAVADGTTSVLAIRDAVADTVQVTVNTSAGVLRTWTGSGGADWLTPTSWAPAGRPNGADTVRVLTDGTTAPTLTGNAMVGTVQVDAGAVLHLGSYTLEVGGDILAGGTIGATTGRVLYSGTGSVVGTLPLLEVTGSVDVSGVTTLEGGLRVLGGTFRTEGTRVTIRN